MVNKNTAKLSIPKRFTKRLVKEWLQNRYLYLMALPALAALFVFSYMPMFGLIMAFKDFTPRKGILGSPFVGFKNFKFLFATSDLWRITRNTVGYNLIFIVLNLVMAVLLAVLLSQINSRRSAKLFQTIYIMPHFLSMAIVSIILIAFVDVRSGYLNMIRQNLGLTFKDFYADTKPWPYMLVFINMWKGVGYSAVVYLAAITGISQEYYEAAMLDGASKYQQFRFITLPHLRAMMSILLIMAVGGIFRGDFGLFYLVPKDSGRLYAVTDIIDTYIYRAMLTLNNPGMATAAGLYQSVVCFILVLVANKIVATLEPDHAMF